MFFDIILNFVCYADLVANIAATICTHFKKNNMIFAFECPFLELGVGAVQLSCLPCDYQAVTIAYKFPVFYGHLVYVVH